MVKSSISDSHFLSLHGADNSAFYYMSFTLLDHNRCQRVLLYMCAAFSFTHISPDPVTFLVYICALASLFRIEKKMHVTVYLEPEACCSSQGLLQQASLCTHVTTIMHFAQKSI